MRLISRRVTVSGDRVSSARREASGDVGFVVASGSALVYKRLALSSGKLSFTGEKTVGYGDECFMLNKGALHAADGFRYSPD